MSEAATATRTEPLGARQALPKHSLILKFAQKYGVDADKLLKTLKDTAFRATDRDGSPIEVTNEQMFALLVVADQYNLNPFTRELYAFPAKGGGIVPIVSIDGWIRIVNERPEFNGVEFNYGYHNESGALEWIEAVMFRKDREHAIKVREWMVECKRGTDPWKQTPSRMLRHRAYIQCARVAFGFSGIYDPEEGQTIIDGTSRLVPEADADTIAKLNSELGKGRPAGNGSAPVALESAKPPAVVIPSTETREPEPVSASNSGAVVSTAAASANPEVDAPSPAFVRSLIARATSADELDEARDLIRFVLDERSRAELDVEERAKRGKLPPAEA